MGVVRLSLGVCRGSGAPGLAGGVPSPEGGDGGPWAAPLHWEPHSLSVVGGAGRPLCTALGAVPGAACVHRVYVCAARSPNGAEAERH